MALSVSGSMTVASVTIEPHRAEIGERAGHALGVIASGSSGGISDLVGRPSSIATIPAPLDVTIPDFNIKNPSMRADIDLVGHEIGRTIGASSFIPATR